MVAERRGGLRIWTVALVIATFVLTLVGTFLTRSGIVASVHSLHPVGHRAVVPGRHRRGAHRRARAAGVAAARSSPAVGGRRALVSRESAFLLNNVLFLALTFAVLFGTLLPMLVAATSGDDDQRRRAVVQPRDGADLRRAPVPDGHRSGAALGRRVVDDGPRALQRPAARRRASWRPSPSCSACASRCRSATLALAVFVARHPDRRGRARRAARARGAAARTPPRRPGAWRRATGAATAGTRSTSACWSWRWPSRSRPAWPSTAP